MIPNHSSFWNSCVSDLDFKSKPIIVILRKLAKKSDNTLDLVRS